ncbi:MAG TPA: sigma-70 family RNA polymerase sigma factor [Thermoanaerobaculia bacterium]
MPRNETDAFERLFRELYQPVLGFFTHRGCSREEGQDLTQDTFARAFRSFDGFRSEAKPSTWVFTIALNVWRNRMRETAAGKRSGEDVPLSEASPESEDRPPDQVLEHDERQRLLRTAVDELPPKMRRCVWSRVYQDRSYEEIARLLGVTATTAKSQVSLATPRLRSSLAEHYPELAADPDDRKG